MERKSLKLTNPASFCFALPPDLLAEVLARLGVKTLLKLRCVSKEWRSLIDSPYFASLHFNLYNNINGQNARLFLIEHGYNGRRCSIRRNDTFRKTCELVLPEDCGFISPFGYVNGLVLCSRCSLDDGRVLGFVVWNPSIRKSIEIPPPSGSHYLEDIRVDFVECAGAANDYKLVVIPFDHPSWNRGSSSQRIPSTVLIEAYSFSSCSWRSSSIDTRCVKDLMFTHGRTVSLNGAVHWIGCDPQNDSRIVAFDVQNDDVRYFYLPNARSVRFGTLSILHGSLVLLELEQGCYQMWVMERYGMAESWVNRFNIDTGHQSFLYLKRNGRLFLTMGKQGVKVYDIESGKIEYLTKTYNEYIVLMDTFVETLSLEVTRNP